MSLFAELKRRKVFRVAIAYLVAAYGILQVANLMIVTLELPQWSSRLVLVLIIVGFVPTLIAAWALELTPDGIRFDAGPDTDKPVAAGKGRKIDFFIIGMLILIVAGLVVERVFFADIVEPPMHAEGLADFDKSVAVLAFADFSQDQDREWFADGLAEEIMNALARTPDILVASRTSAFAYKDSDKDVPTIARELGVAHVLEGSIRSTGDRIRVTAQLIRGTDDVHVWSQVYDNDSNDLIAIQEDVAVKIATALDTTMDRDALARMMRVGTRSVRAYETYVRGLALRARSLRTGDLDDYLESYQRFEEARGIDPGFAAAHYAAADFWKVQLNPTRLPGYSPGITPAEILDEFLERIDLAIDTAQNPTYQTLSRAQKATVQLRLRTALRRFRTFLDARPNDYRAWHESIIVAQIAADRDAIETALAAARDAGNVDRFAATIYVSTAYRHGQADLASNFGLDALARWPNDSGLAYQTHRSLLWAGRVEEASELIARMGQTIARNPVVLTRQACAEGRRADAVQQLERIRSDDQRGVAEEWMILTLLGDNEAAVDVLREYDSGEVPYQLASWLVFHYFDPSPFPSLMQMLDREDVTRPPIAEIPFACPPL